MAATVVTITISEADTPRVIKAICARAGVPESGPNAKAALIAEVRRWVIEEGRREAAIAAPELT